MCVSLSSWGQALGGFSRTVTMSLALGNLSCVIIIFLCLHCLFAEIMHRQMLERLDPFSSFLILLFFNFCLFSLFSGQVYQHYLPTFLLDLKNKFSRVNFKEVFVFQ